MKAGELKDEAFLHAEEGAGGPPSHTHQPAERCSKAREESEEFGCGIFDVFLLLHPLLVGQQMKRCISPAPLWVFHCLFSGLGSCPLQLLWGNDTAPLLWHNSCASCCTAQIREGSGNYLFRYKKINGYFISTCRLAPGKPEWEDFLLYQMLGAAAEMCNLKFICDSLPYYKN